MPQFDKSEWVTIREARTLLDWLTEIESFDLDTFVPFPGVNLDERVQKWGHFDSIPETVIGWTPGWVWLTCPSEGDPFPAIWCVPATPEVHALDSAK